MRTVDTITTVGEALEKITEVIEETIPTIKTSAHPEFGFWFRGQIKADWGIVPSIWVPGRAFDEGSMSANFRLLKPEHEATHTSDFDWLTLMQHYGLPTRLVDWTENLLVALFFAVWREGASAAERESELKQSGAVFLLAGRKLNERVTGQSNISIPTGFHPIARAILSRSSSFADWADQFGEAAFSKGSVGAESFKKMVTLPRGGLSTEQRKLLSTPVAVFPSRRNDRLVAQSGVFTIHGGKLGDTAGKVIGRGDAPLPEAEDLITMNEAAERKGDPFLWKFEIRNKTFILKQLKLMGIHEGTLFPDLAHQAQFMKERWNTPGTPPKKAAHTKSRAASGKR